MQPKFSKKKIEYYYRRWESLKSWDVLARQDFNIVLPYNYNVTMDAGYVYAPCMPILPITITITA